MKFAFVINVFREDDFHSGGEKLFYELVNRSVQDGYQVDLYCASYLGIPKQKGFSEMRSGNEDFPLEKPQMVEGNVLSENRNTNSLPISYNNVLKNKFNKLTFLGNPKDFKYPEKIEVFYRKIKSLTEKEGYDFVITENISPPLDIAILQGHSLIHCQKHAGNWFAKFLFTLKKHKHIKAQKKWLKQPYRKIIVPSEILKEELKENFQIPEEKFLVIYPGVNQQGNYAASPAGKPFTFGLSAPSFGKKGGYIFLKTLNLLRTKGYDFKAKIIYPKYKNNLKLQFLLRKYGLTGRIEFLPYQADMSEFYSSIDCIVVPSVLETFGLVATEAMIRRKPAIISSFSGASEIINDAENGFIFNMTGKNYQNLAEKMEFFLNNSVDYEKISQNAHETALKLNWHNFYEKFKANLI